MGLRVGVGFGGIDEWIDHLEGGSEEVEVEDGDEGRRKERLG